MGTFVDRNFDIRTDLDLSPYEFRDVNEAPFRVFGVFYDSGKFRRMPAETAKSVSDAVYRLHANTAGGRVRFITDSPSVAIRAVLGNVGRMPHFSITGTASLDLYVKLRGTDVYAGTFIPPYDVENAFVAKRVLPGSGERLVTINFPTYSDLEILEVGVEKGCTLKAAPEYPDPRPVVFYGSSITQGGCVSRPGTTYEAILSRRLDFDYVNLGFSGSAKAEDAMIDYLASLEMRAFVLDYDANAPNLEHLEKTHEKCFLAVRRAHPDLPVLFMSHPIYGIFPEDKKKRLKCVQKTYENALDAGDKKVWFVPGDQFFAECYRDIVSVDNLHPNDCGFALMADAIAPALEDMLCSRERRI